MPRGEAQRVLDWHQDQLRDRLEEAMQDSRPVDHQWQKLIRAATARVEQARRQRIARADYPSA